MTPSHFIFHSDNPIRHALLPQILKRLHQQGATFNILDKSLQSPFHFFVQRGYYDNHLIDLMLLYSPSEVLYIEDDNHLIPLGLSLKLENSDLETKLFEVMDIQRVKSRKDLLFFFLTYLERTYKLCWDRDWDQEDDFWDFPENGPPIDGYIQRFNYLINKLSISPSEKIACISTPDENGNTFLHRLASLCPYLIHPLLADTAIDDSIWTKK